MRVFPDTNVLVSAFVTRGLCADIFRIIIAEHDLVLSEHIISELEQVLTGKIGLPRGQIEKIISFLRSFHIIKDHTPYTEFHLRDESDIPVLAAAINSHSDILITGDKDLLEVDNKYGISIVDPKKFLLIIKRQ